MNWKDDLTLKTSKSYFKYQILCCSFLDLNKKIIVEGNVKIKELDLLDLDSGKRIDKGLRQTFSQGVRGGRETDRKTFSGVSRQKMSQRTTGRLERPASIGGQWSRRNWRGRRGPATLQPHRSSLCTTWQRRTRALLTPLLTPVFYLSLSSSLHFVYDI